GAFFIVADGKDNPHLMFDENEEGKQEIGQYDEEVSKNEAMISNFLKGEEVTKEPKENEEGNENEANAKKTIIEYQRQENSDPNSKPRWIDLYSIKETEEIKETNLLHNYNHLLLIRIS